MIALDAGRTFNGGTPPAELTFGDKRIPNPRKDSAPRTILGTCQKTVPGPAPPVHGHVEDLDHDAPLNSTLVVL